MPVRTKRDGHSVFRAMAPPFFGIEFHQGIQWDMGLTSGILPS
jgi:hypothetical protein